MGVGEGEQGVEGVLISFSVKEVTLFSESGEGGEGGSGL